MSKQGSCVKESGGSGLPLGTSCHFPGKLTDKYFKSPETVLIVSSGGKGTPSVGNSLESTWRVVTLLLEGSFQQKLARPWTKPTAAKPTTAQGPGTVRHFPCVVPACLPSSDPTQACCAHAPQGLSRGGGVWDLSEKCGFAVL